MSEETVPMEERLLRGELETLRRCLAAALPVVADYISTAPRGDIQSGPCWCAIVVPNGHTPDCDAKRRHLWEFLHVSRVFKIVPQNNT